MGNWWELILEDFADLPSPAQAIRMTIRLLIAAFLGGILGYERERTGKAAGLRTHMLVSLGSALFVLVPQHLGMQISDLSRVIQGLVTGIGFIGAGAIIKQKDRQEIHGLTTSAGLWLTASVGIAAGLGAEASAVLGTILAFVILSLLGRVEVPVIKSAQDADDDS